MSIKTIQHNKITWHHIDGADEEAINFLKKNFKFHPLDIKDVQGQSEEAKIDIYKKYFFLTLIFPILHRSVGRISGSEIKFFVGKDYLVSIQKGRFKPMRDMYFKLQNSTKMRKVFMAENAGYLLYKIVEELFHDTKGITKYISRKLRELEDEVYSEEIDEGTARRIAYLRRKILAMKRIYDPEAEIVNELSKLKVDFLPEELDIYFDDIDDYVDKVSNFLDNQKNVLKDLLEVHDSLVTHKTNRVIRILTVISVGMLPLTLLSGIYGMNINLPFSNSPATVWFIFVALLFVIVAIMLWFKRKKML